MYLRSGHGPGGISFSWQERLPDRVQAPYKLAGLTERIERGSYPCGS